MSAESIAVGLLIGALVAALAVYLWQERRRVVVAVVEKKKEMRMKMPMTMTGLEWASRFVW